MRHFRILLDLDGTVAQNAGRRVAEEQFGIAISEDRSGESLMEILGMDREQFWTWWEQNHEPIYGRAVPLPGAVEALQSLKDSGAYIAVVTARRSSARPVTCDWLSRYEIAHDLVIMDADDKVEVAKSLGLNAGFEDDPAHALPLADVMPMALMLNHKNLGQEILHPRLERLADWTQALPWLHRLAARTA